MEVWEDIVIESVGVIISCCNWVGLGCGARKGLFKISLLE